MKRGGILALPTEYSYALSEAPEWTDPSSFACERNRRIFQLKERSLRKPVLFLAGSLGIVERFGYLPDSGDGSRLVSRWPGFLTLVLKARPLAIRLGMSSSDGVSFRIPQQILLRRFLAYLGTPLSGTSLNISGQEPIKGAQEAARSFPSLDAVLDGGYKPGKPISHVIDVRHGTPIVVRGGDSLWSPWASRRRYGMQIV